MLKINLNYEDKLALLPILERLKPNEANLEIYACRIDIA
jgi:hypothetical protein